MNYRSCSDERADSLALATLHQTPCDVPAEQLIPLLYRELKRLAHAMKSRRPPGETLQTTDIVHEAYLKLVGAEDPGWDGRAHFFGAAARAMREILVDQARRKRRVKHGGALRRVDAGADAVDLPIEPPREDMLALDEALHRLETYDQRKMEVVNLRFFAGLSANETAGVLGVSKRTVDREWLVARSWLFDQMQA